MQVERAPGYSRLQHDARLLNHQCAVCFARRTALRPVSPSLTAYSVCTDSTHRLSGRVRVAVVRRREPRESIGRAARAGSAGAATPWRSRSLRSSCLSGYSNVPVGLQTARRRVEAERDEVGGRRGVTPRLNLGRPALRSFELAFSVLARSVETVQTLLLVAIGHPGTAKESTGGPPHRVPMLRPTDTSADLLRATAA